MRCHRQRHGRPADQGPRRHGSCPVRCSRWEAQHPAARRRGEDQPHCAAATDRRRAVRDRDDSLAERSDRRPADVARRVRAPRDDVSHPTLRLCRRKDGTWNLQGLLAEPIAGRSSIQDPPPIVIRNGTVELCSGEEPGAGPPHSVPRLTAHRPIAAARPSSATSTLRVEAGEAGRFISRDGPGRSVRSADPGGLHRPGYRRRHADGRARRADALGAPPPPPPRRGRGRRSRPWR